LDVLDGSVWPDFGEIANVEGGCEGDVDELD
jgi:hypothetical protein